MAPQQRSPLRPRDLLLLCALALACVSIGSAASIPERDVAAQEAEWRHALAEATQPVGADEDEIHIHVVSHSHDDTGWLRTVDEYYEYEVSYILDSVVTCLLENAARRFIQVEIAYFERWWHDQEEARKEQVRMLVDEGRLQFVQGGWCMHDEAVTNYVSQINQLTEGHTFLLKEFGPAAIPRIAWHIDPFGASNMSPGLFADAGYEAFVINRVDYRLKEWMKKEKQLEFVWRGSKSLGEQAQMFAHVMDSHYNTPRWFDWEHGVSQNLPGGDGPPPVITNPPSFRTKENALRRAKEFVAMARHRQGWYKTQHILIPFGSDFNFQNALMKFKNMDKMIDTINANSQELKATAQYSTLTDYFDAVHATNLEWNVTQVDFFPYIDNNASYWSGFYSSRPDLKQLSRETDATLRASDILLALTNACLGLDSDNTEAAVEPTEAAPAGKAQRASIGIVQDVRERDSGDSCPPSAVAYNRTAMFVGQQFLRRAAAVSQHHDAVTGTERKHVYKDYAARLQHGFGESELVSQALVAQLFGAGSDGTLDFSASPQYFADLVKGGVPVAVPVFNPLEFTRTDVLMLPIGTTAVTVTDADGNQLPYEVTDTFSHGASLPYDLFVRVTVPPLGYSTIVVAPSASNHRSGSEAAEAEGDVTLSNEYVQVSFASGAGGAPVLASMSDAGGLYNTSLSQAVLYYTPFNGSQTSGAYIFRPDPATPATPVPVRSGRSHIGAVVQQVQQVFNESGISVVTRIFPGLDPISGSAVHQAMHVGPVQVNESSLLGKEVVTRYESALSSGHRFYTDNNGMEMQLRVRNLAGRPGDNDTGVALAGNYYPVVSRMFIRDEDGNGRAEGARQLSVVTAHTHGGSSLAEGAMELMVHRRLLRDDGRGVGQALNDTSEVTARVALLLSAQKDAARHHRRMANVVQYPLKPFFAGLPQSGLAKYITSYSPLAQDLPENIRIISLKALRADVDTVILRVMNVFEAGEDPSLSQSTTIDLATLFSGLQLGNVQERTLTGLMQSSKNVRPTWHVVDAPPEGESAQGVVSGAVGRTSAASYEVTLQPMQIRTFWISLTSP